MPFYKQKMDLVFKLKHSVIKNLYS